MINLTQFSEYHIVGIGGAGMSAIARVLHGKGCRIHGSDRRSSPLTEALRTEGIDVAVGHAPENVGDADAVLASSAVPDDNVELAAARERGIPVIRRPDFLGPLTEDYDVIAVAGAHGKTTVTGMITLMLLEAGLDPTFVVGGVMANLGTNARAGSGKHFVIEADEYRNTFLALKPTIAVVTNIEFDHPDCFPSPRFVRLAFGDFVDNIHKDGALVTCNDDEVAHAVGASYHANGGRLMLYGHNEGIGLVWRAADIRANDRGGVSFTALHNGEVAGQVDLQVPGVYNAVNALAVLTVASALEIDFDTARTAVEAFKGTARRFEILGEVDNIVVIDDYAHHPTQIRSVLNAARQRYAGRRIVAVWEPHTFSRIKALHDDFMTAFEDADRVVVLPIYAAREPEDPNLTSSMLAVDIVHPDVTAARTLDAAIFLLNADAAEGDVFVLMGAGNEYIIGKRLVLELESTS